MQHKMVFLKNMCIMLRIKNIEDEIPDITNLAFNTTINPKVNEVKGEIPTISN